jgi:hypothetical protein
VLRFRRGKRTRDAIGMLRIISERTLERAVGVCVCLFVCVFVCLFVCVCFIDWQKASDRVNWTKLMQVLKGTGIDWHERRLISNLYIAQSVKVQLN